MNNTVENDFFLISQGCNRNK